MKIFLCTTSIRQLLILICCFLPAIAYAQSSQQPTALQSHIFNYSILDTELGGVTDFANLNRIVLYRSYKAWINTRNFAEDNESVILF